MSILYLLVFPLSLYASTAQIFHPTCKFSRQRSVYDLCPILQEPGFTVGEYRFNSHNDNGPASCPRNTWICLNGSQSQSIAVASSHFSNVEMEEQEQGLRIQFKGGTHNGTFHSALIHFVCDTDPHPEYPSAPRPLREHNGIHSFRWATKHACPYVLTDDYTGSEYVHTTEDSESPLNQGEQEEGGENLVDPTDRPRLSVRATALTISIIGMFLFSTCYFIYNPPTHLIDHYLRPNISRLSFPNLPGINKFTLPRFNPMSKKYKSRRRSRPHNFRVGESRLVQWAQEDMPEDDIDVMVNAHDDDNAILDEYVPLSVGIGWQARRPRDYGTTSTQFP